MLDAVCDHDNELSWISCVRYAPFYSPPFGLPKVSISPPFTTSPSFAISPKAKLHSPHPSPSHPKQSCTLPHPSPNKNPFWLPRCVFLCRINPFFQLGVCDYFASVCKVLYSVYGGARCFLQKVWCNVAAYVERETRYVTNFLVLFVWVDVWFFVVDVVWRMGRWVRCMGVFLFRGIGKKVDDGQCV